MYRIAVVGDLSLQSPSLLEKVMAAAWAANPDVLVHVGDIHPGYDVVKKYRAFNNQVLAVPGNHDTEWNSRLGWARQWRKEESGALLIGLDNSTDRFTAEDWRMVPDLSLVPNKPVFIFCHKPLSNIVLSDGSESGHIMCEGGAGSVGDREQLKGLVKAMPNVLLVHGHWHGHQIFHTNYAECLVEGRGGAAPELGFSLIYVQPEGWSIHRVDL